MTAANRSGLIPEIPRPLRLEIARRHIGASQARMGDLLGVSTNTIQRAERGEVVRKSTILAWAMVTGVDLHWLETGTSPSPEDGGGVSEPSSIPRSL